MPAIPIHRPPARWLAAGFASVCAGCALSWGLVRPALATTYDVCPVATPLTRLDRIEVVDEAGAVVEILSPDAEVGGVTLGRELLPGDPGIEVLFVAGDQEGALGFERCSTALGRTGTEP